MSRLFPAPFRQYVRSAIRGDSVGILKPASFEAEGEVFPQPLLSGAVSFTSSHNFATPTNVHKTISAPGRAIHVEACRNIFAPGASWSSSGVATVITPTDPAAPAVFSALAEVEQI